MPIQALAVFCGSKTGIDPLFTTHTETLGALMARYNITLIYGGGNVGQMGTIANAVLNGGGKVTGVIPQLLADRERSHNGLTELLIVPDMHTRKRKLYELCDAAIILPGGYGTMDEFFETLTLAQTKVINDFPIVLYGKEYFEPLMHAIDTMAERGTILPQDKKLMLVTDDMDEAMRHIQSYISSNFTVKPRKRLWWLFEKR